MSASGLAVVTGAATGIGRELAKLLAQRGHDLIVCSDTPDIHLIAGSLRDGIETEAVEADPGTEQGRAELWSVIRTRDIDIFGVVAEGEDLAGAMALVPNVIERMRRRGTGRILVTCSTPEDGLSIHAATGDYLDTLGGALREKASERCVSITCLMPDQITTQPFLALE